jgi:hypothetical protein
VKNHREIESAVSILPWKNACRVTRNAEEQAVLELWKSRSILHECVEDDCSSPNKQEKCRVLKCRRGCSVSAVNRQSNDGIEQSRKRLP